MAEAQAAGCPVIAYGRGGAAEIILDGQTGLLYPDQSAEAIVEAVQSFEQNPGRFQPEEARANALRFSAARFKHEFGDLVSRKWQAFNAK
jgi:glycosyltransferase involved in cell wall biosynthesis